MPMSLCLHLPLLSSFAHVCFCVLMDLWRKISLFIFTDWVCFIFMDWAKTTRASLPPVRGGEGKKINKWINCWVKSLALVQDLAFHFCLSYLVPFDIFFKVNWAFQFSLVICMSVALFAYVQYLLFYPASQFPFFHGFLPNEKKKIVN